MFCFAFCKHVQNKRDRHSSVLLKPKAPADYYAVTVCGWEGYYLQKGIQRQGQQPTVAGGGRSFSRSRLGAWHRTSANRRSKWPSGGGDVYDNNDKSNMNNLQVFQPGWRCA